MRKAFALALAALAWVGTSACLHSSPPSAAAVRDTPGAVTPVLAGTDWFASASGPTPVMRRLTGNRSEPGPFSEYYRTPAGTSLGAHRHTADMHVKVIEGAQFILMGDLESARVQRFDAGNSFVIPAGVWHVEWFETDTLAELSGVGPLRTERPPSTPRTRVQTPG